MEKDGMRVNLLKTAAGLQEIDQLVERQSFNKMIYEGQKATYAYTRYMPKRYDEILRSDGSIYWILKGRIQVRQKILGFEMTKDEGDAHEWCKIVVDPQLWLTVAKPKKAIQGWRYLEDKDAPKDRLKYMAGGLSHEEPPEEMAEELKRLGLI
jgi:hypothetical protein